MRDNAKKLFDGKDLLILTLKKAGFSSVDQAIAEMTLFPHPETVYQTQSKNVFRVIRGPSHSRGKIVEYADRIGRVVLCDNQSPDNTFCWVSPDISFGADIQCNHIYSDSKNVGVYTSLANLCYTPSFLAKLTDTDQHVRNLLRYRAYDLFGFIPEGQSQPEKPTGYDRLAWKSLPQPIRNVEAQYRERLKKCGKSRAALSAREIGWLFSDYRPDTGL